MKNYLIILMLLTVNLFSSKTQKINYRNKVNFYTEKAQSLIYANKDSLFHYTEKALELSRKSGDLVLYRDTNFEIGYLYNKIGYLDSAKALMEKTMLLNFELQDSTGIGKVKNQLGHIAWYQSKPMEARQLYIDAIKIHKKHGNKKELGKSMNNLANLYTRWGDYESAIALFLTALDAYIESGFREGVAWLQYSMSLMYKRVGEYEQSLNYVKKSLRIYEQMARENGDSSGVRICYSQLGFLYTHHLDSLDLALDYQIKALNLARKVGIKNVSADGYTGVGHVYYRMNKNDSAKKYIEESLRLRRESGVESGIASNLKFLGYIEAEEKNYRRAAKYYDDAIKLARRLNNNTVRMDVFRAYSQLHEELGEYEKALTYLTKYIALKDSVLSNEVAKKVASTQLQYEVEKKTRENEVLTQQNKIQQLQIERARLTRNFLIILVLIAVMIILFTIFLYHKQKQIKTLRGLVPICASCKKIRNDKGYYEQVEKYIADHTEANFSHGLCPDCMKKLHPEIYESMQKKNEN